LAQVVTANTYGDSVAEHEKGRLSQTSVTHTRGSDSKIRTSTFGYHSNGMLQWAKIHGINQKTTYDYDSYGNKTEVCVIDENATPNESRCSTTTWSSDGRFVLSKRNALQQTETYLYNGQYSAVNGRIWSTTTTGPNGIATTQYFDIQGQLIKEQRADGTVSYVTRAYSSTTNKSNCTANTDQICFYERVNQTVTLGMMRLAAKLKHK